MEVLCKASPNKMVRLRAQLYTYWGKIGLTRDALMTRKQFIEGVNRLGNIDIKRYKRGIVTFLENLNDAFFDIADSDNTGSLTLEELKSVMIATSMNPQGANTWLKQVDTNNNGVIDRHEFFTSEFNFWYKAKGV